MRLKILIFLCIILHLNLFAENYSISQITSSTYLTQELEESSPDIEVYTSEDIKSMGINNIPDLLNLIAGMDIARINKSTVDIAIRGFPAMLKILPKILIDGMEISENVYNRTYLYNLPVEISDIDRIEILKNTTTTRNGINNIAGIINIVTKSPEELDSNYFYQEYGSKFYKKTHLSINRFWKDIYYKLNGTFKQVDENNDDLKHTNYFSTGLFATKYFENSKLSLKSNFIYENLDFAERGIVAIPLLKKTVSINFNNTFKNMKYYNLLIDYKIKDFDFSLYTQSYTGNVRVLKNKKINNMYTNNNFTKFVILRRLKFKFFDNKIGFTGKYRYTRDLDAGSYKRYEGSFFIENKFKFNNYLSFLGYMNIDKTTNLGTKINYKLSIKFENLKKDFSIRLGYSRSYEKPFMGLKYLSFKTGAFNDKYSFLKNYNLHYLPILFKNNKNLSSYHIKSSELAIQKKFKNFNFYFTGFYNLIYDIPSLVGGIESYWPLEAFIYPINYEDLCIYGFDSKLELKWRNYKFLTTYFHQLLKDKTHNAKKDFLVPENKLSTIIMFNYKKFYGSLSAIYYPSIKFHFGKSDSYLSINSSITKSFFNRFKLSLYVSNIFNDSHREDKFGDNLGREIYLKLQYDF